MLAEKVILDLAIVLIIASFSGYIFHKLKQPIVLGYILTGIIIGPYTPPFSYLSKPEIFSALAELGLILLLFGIGLSFPIEKLFILGEVSLIVTTVKIISMTLGSFAVGRVLGWPLVDSLFLGLALTNSSTAIIAKCVTDMEKLGEESCNIMFGVLMLEDLIVVLILAGLQSFYTIGIVSITSISILIVKLILFLGGSVLIGRKIVLPFISGISRENKEIRVIMTVGVCFTYSVAAYLLGFSVAVGALMAGMVLASWVGAGSLIRETLALRNVFGAIFFVSVGTLMNISKLGIYILPVFGISLFLVIGKIVGISLGTKFSGFGWTTSIRAGLGMAQIGEFAFIVVKVGSDLGVLSTPLFAIIGVVASLTMFLTPYLIEFSYNQKMVRRVLSHIEYNK